MQVVTRDGRSKTQLNKKTRPQNVWINKHLNIGNLTKFTILDVSVKIQTLGNSKLNICLLLP